MTEAELFALPEIPGIEFGAVERLINGYKVTVPQMRAPVKVLFDPLRILDSMGQAWLVGTLDGVRYRQQSQTYFSDYPYPSMESDLK